MNVQTIRGLLPLFVSIAGPLVGLVSAVTQDVWFLVGGTILTMIGSVWLYRDALPYSREFTVSDWSKDGDEFVLSIPPQRHHHGKNVTVSLYLKTRDYYVLVEGDVKAGKDGFVNVIIAGSAIDGKVVIS